MIDMRQSAPRAINTAQTAPVVAAHHVTIPFLEEVINMAPIPDDERWRALAAQASKEMSDEKLLILVQQLCDAFDEGRKPPQSEQDQNHYPLENVNQNQSNSLFLRKPTENS